MSDKALWNILYKTACRPAVRISSVLHLHANVCVNEPQIFPIYSSYTIMADSNRIVFPDEVAEAKANAVAAAEAQDKTSGGDSNTVEEPPQKVAAAGIAMRNMITVPSNCPPGYKMGADGVCREVFN